MVDVVIDKPFKDFDKRTIAAGVYENAVVKRMGYSEDSRNWFWNIIQDGRVVAVTFGYPKNTRAVR